MDRGFFETVSKPLLFASKDSFAHLHTIKDLEPFIRTACSRIESLHLPPIFKEKVKELIENFRGFDLLSILEKRKRIADGLLLIDTLRKESPLLLSEVRYPSSVAVPTPPKRLRHCSAEAMQCGAERLEDLLLRRVDVARVYSVNDIRGKLRILSMPVEEIKGIGKVMTKGLGKKGIKTLEDLLYFLPVRYEDRRKIKSVSQVEIGAKETFTGEVICHGEVLYRRKRIYEMIIGDGRGIIKAKWFHFNSRVMKSRFKKGQRLLVYGEVSAYGVHKEVHHPDLEIIEEEEGDASIHFKTIVPVYSQVERVHQKRMRSVMKEVVERHLSCIPQSLPEPFILKYNLLSMADAIHELHFPGDTTNLTDSAGSLQARTSPAFKTIIFDELFYLELGLALKKAQRWHEKGLPFKDTHLMDRFLRDLLPFSLTRAQVRVLKEIKKDMFSLHPMNRLLQGDVGSGKTVIAFLASLIAIGNGYQSAIMAPTEILSEQHYHNLCKYSKDLGLRLVLLTSRMGKKEKDDIYKAIKEKGIDIVIGTHALIQEGVEFKTLGLAVVDEQHRFGVVQRALLKKKGCNPHILVMTATPIPRTLSMTIFGDLDVSIIDELPPGRRPVSTKVFRERDKTLVYNLIKRELQGGRQTYVVYPLIEESEELDLKDATKMREHLQKDVFPDYKVGLLHGKMKREEKETVMKDFRMGQLNILVATTVIEVGIDIPNVTVMLIEHAERFGLAQLHQLRGRVGRGEHRSYCFLLAYKIGTVDAYKRLKVMERTTDGFKIAEEDLRIRGPGDFLGTRQSGLPDFRIANLVEDISLLQRARDEAFNLIKQDPKLAREKNQIFKEMLKARWKGRLELARVG